MHDQKNNRSTTPIIDEDLIFDDQTSETPTEPPRVSYATREELEAKLNEVEKQLNEANTTIEDCKSQLMRNHAEVDNVRKRANKDIQNAHRYGAERLATALLPIADSLERGISTEVGDNDLAKQMHAGLEMTLKLLLDVLEKSSVKQINPLGEVFNPELHQAISTQENPDAATNTVLQVLQKGYQLHDRLIRPALVIVAK